MRATSALATLLALMALASWAGMSWCPCRAGETTVVDSGAASNRTVKEPCRGLMIRDCHHRPPMDLLDSVVVQLGWKRRTSSLTVQAGRRLTASVRWS